MDTCILAWVFGANETGLFFVMGLESDLYFFYPASDLDFILVGGCRDTPVAEFLQRQL